MSGTSGPRPESITFVNTKSIPLDGVDDFVNVGDSNNLSFGDGTNDSPFSISAWIKIGQTTTQGIVTKYGSTSATREWLFYITGGKLRLLLASTNGGYNFATGTTNLSANTWYHVACTYDGRGGSTAYDGMTLYINGVAESVTTTNSVYVAMSNTNQNVEIGKHLTNELLGNIDETAIFNTELSASDVTAIYNNGTPTALFPYKPLSWWRMGDGDTSPTLLDHGREGNNGTMTNFSTFSTDVPPNPFVNTKSIALDGVDDYVTTTSNYTQLDGQSKMTVSAWIKSGSLGSQSYLFAIGGGVNLFQVGVRLQSISSTNARCWLYISQATNSRRSYADLIGIKNDGAWHHLMVCLDLTQSGGSEAAFFLDGSQLTTNGYYTPTALENSGTALAIGNRENPNTGLFVGNMDEFAIWAGTDLRNDVATIYNSGEPNNLNNNGLTVPTTWYRCGDGDTAPTLTDNGSGGNDGTMTNFSTFSNDIPSTFSNTRSIALDGVDDYVDCGSTSYLQNLSEFSVSLWTKQTTAASNDCLIGDWGYNTTGNFALETGTVSGNATKLTFYIRELGGTARTITTQNWIFTENVWNHIVITFNSGTPNIYVNGIAQGLNVPSLPTSLAHSDGEINIGRFRGLGRNFTGNIDEVSVFTSELSASDVTSIYNGGVPNDITSLSPLSWWRCGDGDTSPTLTDNGSGGNNGTMTNFTTFSTDVPT